MNSVTLLIRIKSGLLYSSVLGHLANSFISYMQGDPASGIASVNMSRVTPAIIVYLFLCKGSPNCSEYLFSYVRRINLPKTILCVLYRVTVPARLFKFFFRHGPSTDNVAEKKIYTGPRKPKWTA